MPPNDIVKSTSGVALLPGEVGTIVEHMLNGMAYCKILFEDGQPCDFIYLYTNPAFESLTGLSGMIGKRVTDAIPGIRETDPLSFEIYGRVAKGGKPEKFETHVKALGTWFSVTVYSPRPEHFVAVFDDITEHKQAERDLLLSNERLSLAQRTAAAGVWDWDIAKGALTWSDEFFCLFGLNPATAIASFDTWRSMVHPDDLQRAEEVIMASIRNHASLFNEYRIVLSTGEVRWIDAVGDTTYDADGNAQRMIGICIDATERKHAEAQIEFLAHHDHLTQLPNRYYRDGAAENGHGLCRPLT